MTSPRLSPPFWRHDAYMLASLARAVRAIVDPLQASWRQATVVDLGAGDAPYRPMFDPARTRYVCCDIDDAAEIPIETGRPVPLDDACADAVVSFQVLEHVWDLDWYLGEAARLLKDDGRLLLSTHGTWLYHPHPTDFRRWTRDGLVKELETRGFAVHSIDPVVGPLAWTTQLRTLGYHVVLSKVPLLGPLLSALLCSIMHLRMKLEDAVTPRYWIETNASTYVVLASRANGRDDASR